MTPGIGQLGSFHLAAYVPNLQPTPQLPQPVALVLADELGQRQPDCFRLAARRESLLQFGQRLRRYVKSCSHQLSIAPGDIIVKHH
jgi:hypothetical protein